MQAHVAASATRSAAARDVAAREAGFDVPFRLSRGVPVVAVTIDGQGPFDMILDTGAGLCIVSPELVGSLTGVHPRELSASDGSVTDVHGRTVDIGQELRHQPWAIMGPASTDGIADLGLVTAAVLPLESVKAAFGPSVEGILGLPGFAGQTLSLDYARRRLGVGDELPPTVAAVTDDGSRPHVVRAAIGPRGLRVPVTWRDQTFDFAIDTASTLSVEVSRKLIWRMALTGRPQRAVGARGLTGGGEDEIIGRLYDDLTLAGVNLRQPIIRSGSDNRIGAGLLRQFDIHIDTRRQLMAFVPRNGHTTLTFNPVRRVWPDFDVRPTSAGLLVTAIDRGQFDEPSPLHVGDLIVRVASHPIVHLQPAVWSAMLGGARPIPLSVRRGDRLIRVVLPVRDIVP